MPILKVPDVSGGVNLDVNPSELPQNQWNYVSNVRFRSGQAEKRRGFRSAFTSTVEPRFLCSYVTPTARLMIAAGTARVFSHNGATESEITRYTDGKTISSITRVTTTATLTTSEAHGLSTGNTVTVYGASPSQYNVTASITVTGATTFTYTMASDPGASATITSASGYSYNVQANFTGDADDKITGGSFNGVLVLNFPEDGMYYWSGDTTKRLRRMPAWPAGQKCDAIFFFKNYIFALAPTVSGTKNEQQFLWGPAAEPGALPDTWTAASTNDAGDSPLPAETGGALVDGATLGDMAFVFDQDACYAVQYIGGNDVFRVFRLPGVDGCLARNCIARVPSTPGGGGPALVYLANGDVKATNGSTCVSIAEGVIRNWLNTQMTTYASRSFVVAHHLYNEVWIYFQTEGYSGAKQAAVWNWDTGVWTVHDFTVQFTCATSGLIANGLIDDTIDSDTEQIDSDLSSIDATDLNANQLQMIAGTHNSPVGSYRIGVADASTQDFGYAYYFTLERDGLDLGDPATMKYITASRPNVYANSGKAIQVYHYAKKTAEGSRVTANGATYTHGTTDWVTKVGGVGRYLTYIITDFAVSEGDFRLRSYVLDVKTQGRF